MMSVPIQVGMKVRIRADFADPSVRGRIATITKKWCDKEGMWCLDIDDQSCFWRPSYFEVICCGAKGCMWHKKDNQ